MSDVITIERLEHGLALVVLDGPVMVPMFERLEREPAAMGSKEAAVVRAKSLLEYYSGMNGRRAIEPPVT